MNFTRTEFGIAVAIPGGGALPIRHVIGVGRNYVEHAEEQGAKAPERPMIFTKNLGALALDLASGQMELLQWALREREAEVAMLRRSFFHLVAFYVSHEPSAELERIAAVHSKIGIKPEFYDVWLDALVATVRELDPACDLPTELSWRWAMTPGLTYMRLLDALPGKRNQT